MKLRFVAPIIVFAALAGVFALMLKRTQSGSYDPRAIASPLIGKPAPPFRLTRVEDQTKFVDNKEFAGKPYVVNVWATWCFECRAEHPALLQIARQTTVPFIGIDWNDDLAQAQRWLSELGNPYTATGYDNHGRVAIDWGVYGAPETFLVGANGTVLYKHIGPMTPEVWRQRFLPLLAQTEQAGAK